MHVDRCVCTGVTLSHCKQLAEEIGAVYEEVLRLTNAGDGCGLCLPYIRVALLTGRTKIPVLTPDEYQRIVAQHPAEQCARAGERRE